MSDTSAAKSPRRKKQLVYKVVTVPGNNTLACDQFNSGHFFECHETFEEIWQEEQGDVRDLYKGLIQIAAAFVHITRANLFGANRLCTTALGYLAPYRATGAMGWDVDRICRETEEAHRRVIELGKERLADFDVSRRPFYEFDPSKLAAEAQRWNAWGFDRDGNALEIEIAVIE
jgi:hypothetical protein